MSPACKQIGLTGSIASGKSTVARLLAARGVHVLNMDDIGREILATDPVVQQEVRSHFGPAVFNAEGTVDRLALRQRVFNSPVERKQLEAILHPRIWKAYHQQVAALQQQGVTRVICEAALLVESQSYKLLDGGLIVVTAPDSVRIQRLIQRDGITETLARQMLDAQLPQSEKTRVATFTIENSGTLPELEAKVAALLAKLP